MYILISYGPPVVERGTTPNGVLLLEDGVPLFLDENKYLLLE